MSDEQAPFDKMYCIEISWACTTADSFNSSALRAASPGAPCTLLLSHVFPSLVDQISFFKQIPHTDQSIPDEGKRCQNLIAASSSQENEK